MDEITTLCGVEACAIIFSENDPQPVIWPSPRGVHTVLSRFRRLPELEQSKKMQNQESFLKERIQKGQEKLKKLRNENRKKELTNLMFQCLNAGQITDNVGMNDLNGLSWLIDQNTRQIERYMEEKQAAAVVENHAENVIGRVQGMENNVDAMQTQHWSLDFMTNNNFGDVLPFEFEIGGGVGVAASVEGVRGGDPGGVSVCTSYPLFAGSRSYLTLSGSFEGFYLCMATLAGQVTYQSKPGYSRDLI
ncbi:agamous-like mads-box protein agl80-like [Trifolium pratense]|uniref:Agamous-like mads-box protein agl80-like n=1 Tax=Trifolium pratense TaxID=57577 RepID=A0A2K3LDX6_TRIPR|nr:agamous-like mads-box protein agl80-like [Trifolium pratense]